MDQKTEAVKRLEMLGVFPKAIRQFQNSGKVSISEPPFGALYWAGNEDMRRIRQFENDHGAMVYLVIRSYTSLGKADCFLYVSRYEEEWEMDREDIENGRALAYVYSFDSPELSESGSIGFEKTLAGGLVRSW